ncbi:SpoIVB peptidase [uncultured Gemmiger sp.]|uniref:SpoIVB peptidase n=1 Tax=uncultured Gemmiger sp. TaxID=1623490 RepID=UPI0025DD9C6F|nr:SpoIVB peptidase [uncultured Gemmiger sp.]
MPEHAARRFVRRMLGVLALTGALLATALLGLRAALPDTFYIEPGGTLTLAAMPFLRAGEPSRGSTAAVSGSSETGSANQTLRLFGMLPVKTVRTVASATRTVTVSGAPFGVKMFADGALVVAFSDQLTALGTENPAKEAGLRLGDVIVSAAGQAIHGNEELSMAITSAEGNPIEVVFSRDGVQHTCTLTPVRDRDSGVWRAGVWVRDSSAGIGTLTFVDTEYGTFAGLGHAVSDSDTGADFPLLSGEIVPVTIIGVQKGAAGAPGELQGEFSGAAALGTVSANDATGVYGTLQNPAAAVTGQVMPVAEIQQVAPGPAQILTTIDGTAPQWYDVTIERVNMTAGDPNRNLLIRVTDDRLLSVTGGIVQGMSGSPVVQNGTLVGAVTHVLVNDPTRGYGIFAATMLERADAAGA